VAAYADAIPRDAGPPANPVALSHLKSQWLQQREDGRFARVCHPDPGSSRHLREMAGARTS
jgi:hypothetical protein